LKKCFRCLWRVESRRFFGKNGIRKIGDAVFQFPTATRIYLETKSRVEGKPPTAVQVLFLI
jgi:hypothetical protein